MLSFWSLFATEILTMTSKIHFYLHLYFTYVSMFHFYLHLYLTFDPHFLLHTSHLSPYIAFFLTDYQLNQPWLTIFFRDILWNLRDKSLKKGVIEWFSYMCKCIFISLNCYVRWNKLAKMIFSFNGFWFVTLLFKFQYKSDHGFMCFAI